MTKDTEPQAFPSNQNSTGMTLRDYFAAAVMQGMLANQKLVKQILLQEQSWIEESAWLIADAMLKAREASQQPWGKPDANEIVQDAVAGCACRPTPAEYAMGYAEGFNDGCKPKPKQEPRAWMSAHDVGFEKSEFGETPTVPLYTTAPEREWVGLTKDEKEALSYKAEGNTWTAVELTEAKLKEKNT